MLNDKYIICPLEKCTGCGLCAYVCKHNAISLQYDKYGFKYPRIDTNICIKCGLCRRNCPSLLCGIEANDYSQRAYACYNKNIEEHKKSSSGGLGYLIAQSFIDRKGVVYGCAFTPPLRIKHIRCTSSEEIQSLRGSKYVQSDISNLYDDIEKDLKNKKDVLFIGTPCQVAGIKRAFSKKYQNLFTVDLICHGTPSFRFLQETLPNIKETVANIKFREGKKFQFTMYSKSDKIIFKRNLSNDLYMKGFFNGTTFRLNCYSCLYAQQQRISDITIGDFWGLKSSLMQNVTHGVSLVLVNTCKGVGMLDSCSSKLQMEERPIKEAFDGNEQLNRPFRKSNRCFIFRLLYPFLGYNGALYCALPDKILIMKIKNLLINNHDN